MPTQHNPQNNNPVNAVPGQLYIPYQQVGQNGMPYNVNTSTPAAQGSNPGQNTGVSLGVSQGEGNANYAASQNAQSASSSRTAPPPPPKEDTGGTTNQIKPRTISINDYLNGNGELSEFLESYLKEEKEKQEDFRAKEKRYKRDKIYASIGDSIAALANVFFASKGAPNMYDPKNSMSAKMRERYDKMMADRDRSRDNILKLGQLKEQMRQADNATRLSVEQFNQQAEQNAFTQNMQNKQFDFNKKTTEEQHQLEKDKFDFTKKTTSDQLEMQKQQLEYEKQRIGYTASQIDIENQKLELERQKGNIVFALGKGENVSIPSNALNEQTVPYLFNMMPMIYREDVHGKPVLTRNEYGDQVQAVGKDGQPLYYGPDTGDMLGAISLYLNSGEGAEALRNEIRQLGKSSSSQPAKATPRLPVTSSKKKDQDSLFD